MGNFATREFEKDLAKQSIDDAAVEKTINKAWEAFMSKSTPQKMGALLWEAMLMIARQNIEIKKLRDKGDGTK